MALQRSHAEEPPEIREPTYEEGMDILDREARRLIGVSGEEFLRRYDAGDYGIVEEDQFGRALLHLEFLIPFARPSWIDEHGRVRPDH